MSKTADFLGVNASKSWKLPKYIFTYVYAVLQSKMNEITESVNKPLCECCHDNSCHGDAVRMFNLFIE